MFEFIQHHVSITILSGRNKKRSGIENVNDFVHLYKRRAKHERVQVGIFIAIRKRLKGKITIQIRKRLDSRCIWGRYRCCTPRQR